MPAAVERRRCLPPFARSSRGRGWLDQRSRSADDSAWRWELVATQVPVTIGGVRVDPGDWVVGDDDGVVVVPLEIAENVLPEAEAKASTESEIRVAVRDGMPPLGAYERFGTF